MTHLPAMAASPYSVAKMTFGEIEAYIKENPAIILPLGATEPCTEYAALGASSLCCAALANALSEKRGILLAPMVTYGYSAGFKAFAGCAAISQKTLAAVLYNLMRSWTGQGVNTFIIIDGTYNNIESVSEAAKRLLACHKEARCQVLNWNHISEVRSFIAQKHEGVEFGVSQVGLLSMAAYLDAGYVRPALKKARPITVSQDEFKRWRKMGGDPEKFRKLFPDARMSDSAGDYSAEFGRTLFSCITTAFESAIARELNL
jgi:creatinine amidohydrolase/Fe(II)-dependent formamide hydrolase-like protein